MLGNGMMGPGIIEGPAVFFGLFFWIGLTAVFTLWFFYVTRVLLRLLEIKYNEFNAPVVCERERLLNLGVNGNDVGREKPERKDLAA